MSHRCDAHVPRRAAFRRGTPQRGAARQNKTRHEYRDAAGLMTPDGGSLRIDTLKYRIAWK